MGRRNEDVKKGKGIRIPREKWLRSIPVRITDEYEIDEDGNAVILLQIEYKGIRGKLVKMFSITPLPQYKKIVLDKMGTTVWQLCDGKHTVDDIIRHLVKKTGMSRRNMEIAIYNYLKTLIEKGLIELHIPED